MTVPECERCKEEIDEQQGLWDEVVKVPVHSAVDHGSPYQWRNESTTSVCSMKQAEPLGTVFQL